MKKTLTNVEWAIISVLWDNPNQTISGIISLLGRSMGWKYNTYVTYIKRLVEKGVLGFHQLGRDKFYYPLIKQEECIIAESNNMLEKMNRQATKDFLVCMIKGSGLTSEDRKELMALLDELNQEGQ